MKGFSGVENRKVINNFKQPSRKCGESEKEIKRKRERERERDSCPSVSVLTAVSH